MYKSTVIPRLNVMAYILSDIFLLQYKYTIVLIINKKMTIATYGVDQFVIINIIIIIIVIIIPEVNLCG